jgi:hypothetical protein
MIEVNLKRVEHVEELHAINKRAFEMALSVHGDPSMRVQLCDEARLLKKRLLHLAEEIERSDPVLRRQWFHPISESLLDFNFVGETAGITSLRLGDIIKWGK